MSFADQWEFFSSIKKLDELLLETIAAKIEKTISNYIEEKIENDEGNKVKKSIEKCRTPLVLSDRLEHLETLKEMLKGYAKNVILITGRGTQKQKKQQQFACS